ncbi:hypothetical protein [Arcticibacter tournemirensis]|uniref:Adenylosuccinate lyase n=1 Tax=Arcticibacter tournemirensis TaxID=699437 RepID=A0A4V1KIF3_9SPHI|nr:hypothetical protein [Arcticibacter tournemirensis]RXF70492.1 hypothetical protein EKH83_07555 [Arcticibacter tournemirensis]
MTKDDLLKALQQTLIKTKAVKISDLSELKGYSLTDLLDLTFHHETAIAFRAAWVLETVQERFPERFDPLLTEFLNKYPLQKNFSSQRHYTKILFSLIEKNRIAPGFDFEQIIESTFEWLAMEQTPVAVKANCMSILYLLKEKDDWIADELKAEIEFLMKTGGAAIQSRGKKILSLLA